MKTHAVPELAQTLFEEIGDAVFIADPMTLQLVDANPFAQRITGLSRLDLLRLPLDTLFRSDNDRALAQLQHALHTTQTLHSQEGYHLRCGADQTWIPVNLTITRLFSERGQFGLVLARDISERIRAEESLRLANANLESKVQERTAELARINEVLRAQIGRHEQAEAALRESEERFRGAFEHTNLAMVLTDIQNRFLRVNDAFGKLFGYRPSEMLGMAMADITHPDDLAESYERREALLAGERPFFQMEKRYLHKKGNVIWGLTNVSLVRDAKGVPLIYVGQVLDISRRKRTEARLRESHGLLNAVVEGTADAVFIKDREGRYLLFNGAASQMVGKPVNDVIGRNDLALFDEASARVVMARDQRVLATGQAETEEEVLTAAGVTRVFLATKAPYRNNQGEIVGVIGISRDVTAQKRAQDELRASEERYRSLFESNPHPMWVYDAETLRFLAVNEAASAHYGYSRAEFLGMTIRDIRPPEDVEVLLDQLAQPLPRLGRARIWRHRKKDGSRIDVEISSHELIFDGRNARLVLAHDVTARRRAEAARERLIAILEATPDLVAISQVDRPVSYLNAAGRQLLGVGADETIFLLDHRSESGRNQIREAIAASIRDGVWSGETVLLNRAGQEIPVSQVIIAHKDASGAVEFLSTVARDIRAQKQLDEQLMRAQQRLQHVIVSNPAVLFTLKIDNGQIQAFDWISDNLQELLGYSPEEAYQPEWWARTIHPEDQDALTVRIQDELLKTGRSSQEVRFRHRNGKELWTRTEIRLIRDAAGRPLEAVGSWSDVTERKLIEEQFRQAQKMEAIGRLAGGVAHDFNNLLTIINGYGEVMLGNLPASDPNRELVREMVAAGERASGLTRQLLAFSRKAVIEPKVMDLRSVVTDVDRMLRRIVGEDIQLTVAADPESGAVRADRGQIEQVILNLVVNARDAMPRGGRITIEVRNVDLDDSYCRTHVDARVGPHVLLSVADTGHGMDQATIARVFEPFFTTKGEQGTGIGLATVHGIAKLSGGHVAVYSEVGHGTTFKFYLPRIDARPAASAAQRKQSLIPGGTETILLVEDEDAVRALTRHVLSNCGYRILEARDGNEAMILAKQHDGRIDLLVTDVVMPRIGGRELATRLTEMLPGLKVLFLSGYTDDAIVRHGILEAEVSFLQKPFTPSSLAAKIREVLDGR